MPDVSLPLTALTRRADAAAVVRRGSALPAACAMMAAELVDALSAAVLRTAGCTDEQAREALAALWR